MYLLCIIFIVWNQKASFNWSVFCNLDSKNETINSHKHANFALSLPLKSLNIFYWLLLHRLFSVFFSLIKSRMYAATTGGVTRIMKRSVKQWVNIVGRLLFQSFSYKNVTPSFSFGRTMLFLKCCVNIRVSGLKYFGIFSAPGCNQASALPRSILQAFLNESKITITGKNIKATNSFLLAKGPVTPGHKPQFPELVTKNIPMEVTAIKNYLKQLLH